MASPKYWWPVTVCNDMGKRTVYEDFEVEVEEFGIVARVPKGFRHFDGASIPKVLWSAMSHPYTKEYERAALVHDYLYKTPSAREQAPYAGVASTREQIDRLFFRMLVQDGVRHRRAKTMYRAVKRYGDNKGRFWTGTGGQEPSAADEAEVGHAIKNEAMGLLNARANPMAASFSVGGSEDDDVDEDILAGLAEINWAAIDPDNL